ncbi:MAG: ABC transporter substrate-binding protein [Chloroflexi bacterium]|nr:ABC transporter substrate-binding protein [Chloroflexota bacterium]
MQLSKALKCMMLAAALFALVACGSSNDDKSKDTKPAATTSGTQAAVTTGTGGTQVAASNNPIDKIDLGSEKVTITFWHTQQGPNAEKLKEVINGFQTKYPNITIDAQFTGNYTDNYKKINTAIQGGGLPDVAVSYPSMVSDYQASKKVVELDNYVNSTKYGFTKEELADFYEPFLAESRNYPEYGNKYLSFPFTKSMLVMYYNNTALKAAGLKVPETWDDFRAAAKKLSTGTAKGYAYEPSASTFKGWVFSRGGKVITDDYKTWSINAQPGVDTLTFLQDMIKEGSAYQTSKAFNDQVDFGAQQAFFTMGSTSGIPFYEKEVGGKFEWGLANLPHATSSKAATVLYGGSIVVFNSTPQKQLASWLFIKYFSSPEVTADWATTTGYFPVRKSAANSEVVKKKIAQFPSYGVALNQILPTAIAEESTSGSQDVRTYIEAAMTAVVSDLNKKPKEALDDANQKAQKALGR